jgi:putative membrane protein
MMYVITKLLLVVLALLFVAHFVPGVEVTSFYIAAIVAILLGIINITIKPILLLLTLPLNLITLGLFTFVLNALLFWFVASFVDGFEVAGFFAALVASFIVSAVSWVGNKLL